MDGNNFSPLDPQWGPGLPEEVPFAAGTEAPNLAPPALPTDAPAPAVAFDPLGSDPLGLGLASGVAPVPPMSVPPMSVPPMSAPPVAAAAPAVSPALPAPLAFAAPPAAPTLPTTTLQMDPAAAPPAGGDTTGLTLGSTQAAESSYSRPIVGEDAGEAPIYLTDLLTEVFERGASDLHLAAGSRPMIRLHGHLIPLEDRQELTPPVIQKMMYAIITQKQRERFEAELELDFAYAVPGKARFRVNLYRQRDALGGAFRLIPYEIKPLETLGIPAIAANFAMLPRGFVLVTGPTGSGKSTTLASIVDLANRSRRDHIMTVEDPIEFLHHHQRCLVNQREVGEDTHSFQNALKHVLRQDPDIILVGEMRDLETISVALTAAETGHLVFATLHTQDAAQTIDRVIDVFPPHQQQQVRVQLAGALQAVICQTLCRTYDGRGRAVATEILVATPAIRNLIREGKTHQIYSAMQAGGKFGMLTMDQHLAELVKNGQVTYETGLEKCHHVEDFNRLCGRG